MRPDHRRLRDWVAMEEMRDEALTYDDERREQVERDLRRLCRWERRQLRRQRLARARRVWVADETGLSCELVRRKPYCYTVTVTNRDEHRVLFAESFVTRNGALFEAEVLRRVFAGVSLQ